MRWDTRKGASGLNEHADEVLGLFRDGVALARIGARFGFVATAVQNWLKARGEYEREVECELPECGVRFPFRPQKRYCSRLHVRRANARARNARPQEKLKNAARNKLRKAVYEGRIVRPTACERCGSEPGFGADGRNRVQADHHHGYDDECALDVWWICVPCDAEVERLRRGGATVTRERPCRT